MKIAVSKETFPGERRVALIPATISALVKSGHDVLIEAGAGEAAGFPDAHYSEKGAKVVSRPEVFDADCVLQIRAFGANLEQGKADLDRIKPGQVLIGMCDPLGQPNAAREIAKKGATLLSLEMIPRITRAQSMDVLSSQATIAGYRAVLLASLALPKMFPMMTTAAGTLTPAKVFINGAGVAGLQAIAAARRLGAVVSAYDVRATVKEQVQSLGGRFVELQLDSKQSEGTGGYAKAADEEFYRKQRELLTEVVATNDVVITTAAIPGKKAPIIFTADMVRGMRPGSVLVDVAAERGGNCELTKPGETVEINGVTILGPTNLPSEIPNHASQMFAKNVTTFLGVLVQDGQFKFDTTDEIIRETLVCASGEVVHPKIKELLEHK